MTVLLYGFDVYANLELAAILIIKIGFLKGSRRLPFKKPILGVATPKIGFKIRIAVKLVSQKAENVKKDCE